MKPPQFILTQEKYFENIDEDFKSEGELKLKYPFLHKSIQQLSEFLALNLSAWEVSEGYIIDDYYEITYNLKANNAIYFMVSGNLSDGKVVDFDFEMSKEVSDVTDAFIESNLEEDG